MTDTQNEPYFEEFRTNSNDVPVLVVNRLASPFAVNSDGIMISGYGSGIIGLSDSVSLHCLNSGLLVSISDIAFDASEQDKRLYTDVGLPIPEKSKKSKQVNQQEPSAPVSDQQDTEQTEETAGPPVSQNQG